MRAGLFFKYMLETDDCHFTSVSEWAHFSIIMKMLAYIKAAGPHG